MPSGVYERSPGHLEALRRLAREDLAEGRRKYWEDPRNREKQSRVSTKLMTRLWTDPEWRQRPKVIENMRKAQQMRWKDPEEYGRASERMRETQIRRWIDPEAHRRHSRIMSEVKGTPEARARVSETQSEYMKDPEVRMRLGETLERTWADPEVYAARTGENHPNWRGGRSGGYGEGWDAIRYFILVRDRWTCQECDSKELLGPHHIDYNKENMEDSNLITLCRSCNLRANFDREYWQERFILKIKGKLQSVPRG